MSGIGAMFARKEQLRRCCGGIGSRARKACLGCRLAGRTGAVVEDVVADFFVWQIHRGRAWFEQRCQRLSQSSLASRC